MGLFTQLRICFFGLSVVAPLWGARLTITNDSSYSLTAVVYNARNVQVSSVQLYPNQTFIWEDNGLNSFDKQYNHPYSPYTVRWYCAESRPYDYAVPKKTKNPKQDAKERAKVPRYRQEYASWTQVSTGSTVNALGAPGGHKTCVIPRKKKKAPFEKEKKIPLESTGFNKFSNDGGQTWTNDGGPGWQEYEDKEVEFLN